MENKLLKRVILSAILFVAIFLPTCADAEETLGFTVEQQLSSTQIDRSKSFFYIRTKPEQEQELTVKLVSTQENPVQIKLSAVNAFTQSNGEIGYTADLNKLDETLQEPITSMVTFEKDVIELQQHETKMIKMKVTAPNKHYDGVKAGGLVFTQLAKESTGEGMGSEYSYRIGLMTSEETESYNDSKTLVLKKVEANAKKGKKLITAVLQNPEPKILDGINFKATIINKKNKKVIKEMKRQNYKFAPNSFVDLDFDWGIERLPAGKYSMQIEAVNANNSWSLSKDFEISGESAQKINESSVYKLVTPVEVKVAAITLVVITITTILYLTVRRKQWEKIFIEKRKNTKSRKKKVGEKCAEK